MNTKALVAQNSDLRHIIMELLAVKDAADGRTVLISNQGQALDGFSELAAYRRLLERVEHRIMVDPASDCPQNPSDSPPAPSSPPQGAESRVNEIDG